MKPSRRTPPKKREESARGRRVAFLSYSTFLAITKLGFEWGEETIEWAFGFPKDARIVESFSVKEEGQCYFIFYHPSFKLIEYSELIPEISSLFYMNRSEIRKEEQRQFIESLSKAERELFGIVDNGTTP